MAGKSTYADLVKKSKFLQFCQLLLYLKILIFIFLPDVANSSPEPEELEEKVAEVLPKETHKSKNGKNKKQEKTLTEEFPSINGDLTNRNESKPASPQPEKVTSPQPTVTAQPAEPEEEVDDTGFILIKARERKNSTASRQSTYRNSSSKPKRNFKRSENGDSKKEVKKMSFDEKKDEEKAKFLKRFRKNNFITLIKILQAWNLNSNIK